MAKELTVASEQEFIEKELSVVFNQSSDKPGIDKDYFIRNYKSIMTRYISNGMPSEDTKTTYFSAIDQFLAWCFKFKLDPLGLEEQHLIYYRNVLVNQNLKHSSIQFKLTAIRRFYYVAIKYKLIKENPAEYVHSHKNPNNNLPPIKYLTADQLNALLDVVSDSSDEIKLRTKIMILLMAREGLRTVEVNRMNVEDINWNLNIILIRGKGKNAYIYPSEYTLKILKQYLSMRTPPSSRKNGSTPVFTILSNFMKHERISRRSIRRQIDAALLEAGFKAAGNSCHMLRHTCGTLLYEETGDIIVVKETLRHNNVETTSRYTHVQKMLLKRYTESIPIKKED